MGANSLQQNSNWHGECIEYSLFQRRQVWWLLGRAKEVELLLESCPACLFADGLRWRPEQGRAVILEASNIQQTWK